MASAIELARAHACYVSAVWRGDPLVGPVGDWFAAFWHPDTAQVPAGAPVAVSPCGAGGRGIRWYDSPTAVLGCIPGCAGCYRIPADTPVPAFDGGNDRGGRMASAPLAPSPSYRQRELVGRSAREGTPLSRDRQTA